MPGKRVLIACEFSGIVRDAFIKCGYDATSCDLLPTELPGPHIQGDLWDLDLSQFDLMIAHPPCTYLCVSGARWFSRPERKTPQLEALYFIRWLLDAPVKHIAIENPIGIFSRYEYPSQIIQPWQFGHKETKATCLWLRNLPDLKPTKVVKPDFMRKPDGMLWRDGKGRKCSPAYWKSMFKPDRWKDRSRTYQGVARAMAKQWGSVLNG